MTAFVQVVVNVPAVSGIFDYSIPAALLGQVGIGHLVIAPFGKQTVQGVVFRFVDQASVPDVREITELVDVEPVLTPAQIALAEALAESTYSSLAAIVSLFLPAGISQEADTQYALRPQSLALHRTAIEASTIASRIVRLLEERGPLRGRQLDAHFRKVDWRRVASSLVRKGVLESMSVLPPARVRSKLVKTAQLAVAPDVLAAQIDSVGKTEATQTRRKKALQFLAAARDAVNVSWVYAESGSNLSDLQDLQERGLIRLFETEIFRDPLEKSTAPDVYAGEDEIDLTSEQAEALNQVMSAMASPGSAPPFLLQGVTGSGKTEIYLRAAAEAIRRGKQVIVLVPEIALTPQTVHRFLRRFPGEVGLVHSQLSEGERYDTWRRARSGDLKVMIGARSALFSPLPNPGLIVADECHDSSYYQADPPFYHAIHAASMYSRLTGAACVLGSATPTVVQRYQAERFKDSGDANRDGTLKHLQLPRRIFGSGLPPVEVVDMRVELKAGQRGIFSRFLLTELQTTLEHGEQAILFLNRRGTASYIFCRDCGHVLRCPECETPLTLHLEAKEHLLCHHCGYERGKPQRCPACGSSQIREYGLGSERVEKDIQTLFPGVKTLRWDRETTREKHSHDMILSHFAAHRADILIGTQMLAKGLDLPLVTLVGVVLAEVGLYLPDPFASERVFQVLTQVAGRAGRSERGGHVILQTFDPSDQVIQSAARHDVEGFYRYELEQRRRLGYPPFSRLIRLEFRHRDPSIARAEALKLASRLRDLLAGEGSKGTTIIGPAPSFFAKLGGSYRWQIVLRGPDPLSLLRDDATRRWVSDWRVEADPISLL